MRILEFSELLICLVSHCVSSGVGEGERVNAGLFASSLRHALWQPGLHTDAAELAAYFSKISDCCYPLSQEQRLSGLEFCKAFFGEVPSLDEIRKFGFHVCGQHGQGGWQMHNEIVTYIDSYGCHFQPANLGETTWCKDGCLVWTKAGWQTA